MKHRSLAAAIAGVALCHVAASTASAGSVTLNTNTQYQTIRGWTGVLGSDQPSFQTQQLVKRGVNELGLTAARLDGPNNGVFPSGHSWVFRIDGTNPSRTNWASFDTMPGVQYSTNMSGAGGCDESMAQWVVPMKQLVEANGDPFTLVNNPSFYYGGSTCTMPNWMQYNYGEYAEYLVSYDEYLLHRYGVMPTYDTIINEAGNGNAMTPFLEAKVIKAIGPMLQAAGLSTKIQLAEGVGANVAVTYAQDPAMDSNVWKYVGTISYHNYQGNSANKTSLYGTAVSHGVMTVQEEMSAPDKNAGFRSMYDDLVNGGVSIWGLYALGGYGSGTGIHYFNCNYDGASITVAPVYYTVRQVMHYVRPGAVRVGATSSDTNILAMAFQKGGRTTVVLSNIDTAGDKSTTVTNLPPGVYGVSYATSIGSIAELGLQTVDASGALTVTVLDNTVMTIYAYGGTNMPPEIYEVQNTTDSNPIFLKTPASSVTLTVNASDPELDALTYNWRYVSGPGGATVSFVNSNVASAAANGLTVAGSYFFVASVSDGHNTSTRQVSVNVYSGNQPPFVQAVQARPVAGPPFNPPLVTLPQNAVLLRGQLPYDLENDTVNFAWSVTNQPPGASPLLLTPTSMNCILTNMTVAGDYVVQLVTGDSSNPNVSTQRLTVSVDPLNLHAPTNTITGASYVEPGHGRLQATASDADGDWIANWWDVNATPAGATVRLDDPASPTTDFYVDTPGNYKFQLFTVDRTLWCSSAVVTVSVPAAAPLSAGFTATPTNGGAPLTVTFSDTSTGTITNRLWAFGDGTTSNAANTNFSFTYRFPGTNSVQLFVSGPLGVGTNARPNLIVTTSVDSVGDGIPNWWRSLYFGGSGTTTNAASCATADPDGDGSGNLQEYLAGTDPTNGTSRLSVVAISNAPPPEATNIVVRWLSASNRLYRLERSTNLVSAPAFDSCVRSNIPAVPPVNTETDRAAVGEGPWFYQIRVE